MMSDIPRLKKGGEGKEDKEEEKEEGLRHALHDMKENEECWIWRYQIGANRGFKCRLLPPKKEREKEKVMKSTHR